MPVTGLVHRCVLERSMVEGGGGKDTAGVGKSTLDTLDSLTLLSRPLR